MSKWTPGPYLRDGTTVYALNVRPENVFYANVQGGFTNIGQRTSREELEAVATLFSLAPEMAEALRELATAIERQLRNTGKGIVPSDRLQAALDATGAILAKLEA